MEAQNLATKIAHLAIEKKGQQVVVLNVKKLSNVTDFFVVVSADSELQLRALADNIEKKLRKEEKIHIYNREGSNSSSWILMDYVDVVVHLFRKETREFYSIEKLCADADMKLITENGA